MIVRVLFVAACISAAACTQPAPAPEHTVTIYRDAYGVPHVHGRTDADAAYGFGYAQAEDNYAQIEENFIRAAGRAAEIQGEEGLVADWINRSLQVEKLSRDEYEASSPALRALLDAYVEGVNQYAEDAGVERRVFDRFEPWQSLAYIRFIYYQGGFVFTSGLTRDDLRAGFAALNPEASRIARAAAPPAYPHASNSWAVRPELSDSGAALLFINPHLPFFGPAQVYEGHVISDAGWNYTGYSRFGFPLPYVGFNEHLGWASTDNAADMSDAYALDIDRSAEQWTYPYADERREAPTWHETIRVKKDDAMEERELHFARSHHGPILGERDGSLVAVRMAKYEEPGWLDQWYAMSRAQDHDSFIAAASRLDMLFGNYLYADDSGNVHYVYNAAVPRRNEGYDWRGIVDGSDPRSEWLGYHPMDDIPQVLNPPSGWVQNANGTPFLSTVGEGNPQAENFPSYMVTEGDNPRHRRARSIFAREHAFSFDRFVELAFDTYMISAEEEVPGLIAAADGQGVEGDLAEAIELLRAWDLRSSTRSVETTLFILWMQGRRDGLGKVDALATAIEALRAAHGDWRVAWGDINRLQPDIGEANAESLPIAGVPGMAGAAFTFYRNRLNESAERGAGTSGHSYVAVIEFGSRVRAETVHTFGASDDPASPHYFDQARLYANDEFKQAWLYLDDVRANAVEAYAPGERGTH